MFSGFKYKLSLMQSIIMSGFTKESLSQTKTPVKSNIKATIMAGVL
jgi:hypothetical protein